MSYTRSRIFLEPVRLESELISLYGDDFHHLAHSLRVREGEEVDLGDGQGLTVKALVQGIFRDHLELVRTAAEFYPRERPSICLFQGVAKGNKLDTIVRQNVELGVDRIVPFVSAYTVPVGRPAEGARLERLRKVAREAAKQSRRPYVPEVVAAVDIPALLELLRQYPFTLVAWEAEERKAAEALPQIAPESVALVVGPEGGFSAGEIEQLRQAGAVTVGLGRNVLRTETAGLVCHSAVRCHYGLL